MPQRSLYRGQPASQPGSPLDYPIPRTYDHRSISSRAGVASRAMAYVRSDGTCGMSAWSLFRFVSKGCLLTVPSYRLLLSYLSPLVSRAPTYRHRAGKEELRTNHHGRALGFLQCCWLVLFHLFAIHAGGATCPCARTTGGTRRGEQQRRWDRGRRRQQHFAAPRRQHSRSTSILSSRGAGWRVLRRGLWLRLYEGC